MSWILGDHKFVKRHFTYLSIALDLLWLLINDRTHFLSVFHVGPQISVIEELLSSFVNIPTYKYHEIIVSISRFYMYFISYMQRSIIYILV